MRKYLTLLLLLFVNCSFMQASLAADLTEEMQMKAKNTAHDSSRLAIYDRYIKQFTGSIDKKKQCITLMQKEAEQQNNEKYMAKAYLLQLYTEYNEQNITAAHQWMEKLEPLARKLKDYDLLFVAQESIADLLLASTEHEQAEQTARNIIKEAQKVNNIEGIFVGYKCLGNVYRSTFRQTEAVKVLEAAFELFDEVKNESGKLELVTYMTTLYRTIDDLPNWLKYLKVKEKEIERLIKEEPSRAEQFKGDMLLLYLSYMRYYITMDIPDMALHYKLLADQHSDTQYLSYLFNYYKDVTVYYKYVKQWDKALELTEKLVPLTKKHIFRNYPIALETKAELLYNLGQEKEALALSKEAAYIKDTMQLSIFKKQIGQIKSDYNISQVQLEETKAYNLYQLIVLLVIVMLLIGISYVAFRAYHVRKQLKKSEYKLRKIALEVEKASKTKENFLSNISYAIQTPLNKVVQNSLRLTSNEIIGEEKRNEIAQTILKTSDNLINLINEILDLSRLEAGKMKFNSRNIDFNALIRYQMKKYSLNQNQLISSFTETEQLLIHSDEGFLSKVIGSLMAETNDNATLLIKMKRKEEGVVSVKIMNTSLASKAPSQEVLIRNEINRMVIEHFGGKYRFSTDHVWFTLKSIKTKEEHQKGRTL